METSSRIRHADPMTAQSLAEAALRTRAEARSGVTHLAYLRHMAETARSATVKYLFEAYAVQERLRIEQMLASKSVREGVPRSHRNGRASARTTGGPDESQGG
jgi:hypothetical protein